MVDTLKNNFDIINMIVINIKLLQLNYNDLIKFLIFYLDRDDIKKPVVENRPRYLFISFQSVI